MNLIVNGKEQNFSQNKLTIAEILTINKVSQPDMVTVQLNEEFVDKAKYTETILNDNDKVDFLYFMGGGGL